MDLRVLQYFVTTVDAGSMSAAAQRLHVTQPVLSRRLRQWERQIGLTIFERDGRGLRLSNAGEALLPQARRTLEQADAVSQTARQLASGRLAAIHLAALPTTLTDVVAPFLAGLGADDPLPFVEELVTDAQRAVRSGADLVITPVRPGRALASIPLARLPIWAYAPGGAAWLERCVVAADGFREVTLTELVAEPLVLLTERFRPRVLFDRAVDAAGLAAPEALECTNAQVAQALAAAGRGVAVVSDDPRFDLRPVRIRTREPDAADPATGTLQISLFAAWRPDHHAAADLADFAGRLAEFTARRYATADGDRAARSAG